MTKTVKWSMVKNMEKVFVLVQGTSGGMTDRAYLYGVYSSREKAQQTIDALQSCDNPDRCFYKHLEIVEVVVDSAPVEVRIV